MKTNARLMGMLTAASLALLLSACGGGSDGAAGTGQDAKVSDASTNATAATPATTVNFGGFQMTTAAASVKQAVGEAAAPIAAEGVRGDALLTMMDQMPCYNPVQSTAHNGTALPEAERTLPPMWANQILTPFNYRGNGMTPYSSQVVRTPNGICLSKFFEYQPAQPGTYDLTVQSGREFRYIDMTPPTRQELRNSEYTTRLTITADTVTVGGDDPFSFRQDAQVGYGVLKYWVNGQESMKLMLVPGDTPDEARVCWNLESASVKRLHCMSWRAPEGWKRGDRLEIADQYLIDDRTVYDGETGFLYGRAAVEGNSPIN